MESLDELLRQAEAAHGHLCAGQVLGVRMALLGLARLGIADPRGADRKRLVTYVEIDRCATDAIALVTGCRLGKRALKFRDWGKMAATFVDLVSGRAIRIVALENTRELARTALSAPGDKEAAGNCRPIANCRMSSSSANSGCASPSIRLICPAVQAIASCVSAAARA